MTNYIWRDGSRLTPWMNYQIDRLNADFFAKFGCYVVVRSGIRLAQEQIDIFLQRYVTAGNVNGRRVYDTRWWRGVLWFRISSAGTVATPSTSNHEVQGTTAAVDLGDTGSGPGVSVNGSTRANWLRRNASKYGLVPSGYGFGEAWHYDVLTIFATPPNNKPVPEETTPEEEDEFMALNIAVGQYIGGDASTPALERLCVIYYPLSGFYTLFSGSSQDYINSQAIAHGTGNFATLSEDQWLGTVKPNLDKLLNSKS